MRSRNESPLSTVVGDPVHPSCGEGERLLADFDIDEPHYSHESTIPCVCHWIAITDPLGDDSSLGDWQFICHIWLLC
jgi:hypothetical protein